MDLKFRERCELQGHEALDWSDWIIAMAPTTRSPGTQNINFKKRRGTGQEGYRNKDLANELAQARVGCCGIYEWCAVKYVSDQDGRSYASHSVVYVGCTCRRRRGRFGPRAFQAMQERIVAYTKGGNHKKDLINDALRIGWELWVRFKPAENVDAAKSMENNLLRTYNYPWNVRNNGVRPILERADLW